MLSSNISLEPCVVTDVSPDLSWVEGFVTHLLTLGIFPATTRVITPSSQFHWYDGQDMPGWSGLILQNPEK